MCSPGILPQLLLVGILSGSAILLLATLTIFLSFLSKKPKLRSKYVLSLFVVGILILSVAFGAPFAISIQKYMNYPGPSYSSKIPLKSFVTSHPWEENNFCDSTQYQFMENGNFTIVGLTDYLPPPTDIGTWQLEDYGNGKGMIILYIKNQEAQRLSIQTKGKMLTIGDETFYGISKIYEFVPLNWK